MQDVKTPLAPDVARILLSVAFGWGEFNSSLWQSLTNWCYETAVESIDESYPVSFLGPLVLLESYNCWSQEWAGLFTYIPRENMWPRLLGARAEGGGYCIKGPQKEAFEPTHYSTSRNCGKRWQSLPTDFLSSNGRLLRKVMTKGTVCFWMVKWPYSKCRMLKT